VNQFYSKNLDRNVIMLRAGEYHASSRGDVLYTILGSCIATCIYDTKKKIGGMNHFLLPGMLHPDEILTSDVGRYGMYAMELLIGELIKHGARRKHLEAKVFGGGNVLNFRNSDGAVTESNIRFAKKYLELEQIPTVSRDLGGNNGRKILFFPDTAKVLLKRFDVHSQKSLIRDEQNYKAKIFSSTRNKPSFVMF